MYKPSIIFHFLFSFVLLTGMSSCYDTDNTYGGNLVSSAFRNVAIDTSTVVTTAVLIDSLETSGKSVLLAGKYTHPIWGTVSASSYLPYNRPSYSTDIEEAVALDSLILVLGYNGQCVGDTTLMERFTIHRLTEKVILNDNDYLYNNSSFAYDPEPLTSFEFKPRPHSDEWLEIRLPDRLGEDLLTHFHSRDDAVSTDRFEEYFKGLVVVPDESTCQSLVSFQVGDTLSSVMLYYHVKNETAERQCLLFTPNTTTQFNQIRHDRTSTPMEGYPAKKVEIPSSLMDNRSLLFGGIGWYTRVEFPYLNDLMQQGKQIEIESAYLKIYPEQGTYSDYNNLPDSIYLYIADENNVVTDAVTDYLGEEVQSGVLVKDEMYAGNTYYYFDITTFISEELGAIGMYKHNLQLVLSDDDYTGTLRNLTFSDQQGRSPIVLQLIYKIYESY